MHGRSSIKACCIWSASRLQRFAPHKSAPGFTVVIKVDLGGPDQWWLSQTERAVMRGFVFHMKALGK